MSSYDVPRQPRLRLLPIFVGLIAIAAVKLMAGGMTGWIDEGFELERL